MAVVKICWLLCEASALDAMVLLKKTHVLDRK